jgi:hypothetical protein
VVDVGHAEIAFEVPKEATAEIDDELNRQINRGIGDPTKIAAELYRRQEERWLSSEPPSDEELAN